MKTLRPYQTACVDALMSAVERNVNACAEAACGAGKTLIGAELCRRLLAQGKRVLVVTHRRELIKQISDEIPSAGVLSAGLNRRQFRADVIVGGIQTIMAPAKAALNLLGLGRRDVVLVDEAHRCPLTFDHDDPNDAPKNKPAQYVQLFQHFQAKGATVLGLSATPFRLDGHLIYGRPWHNPDAGRTEIKPFQELAYSINLAELLSAGYLTPIITPPPGTDGQEEVLPNLTTVGLRIDPKTGDYDAKQLAEAAENEALVRSMVARLAPEISKHVATIVFCASVKHAGMVARDLLGYGITSHTVTADTPSAERRIMLEGFKARSINVLLNVGVLTEGFDAPHVDLVALLRPTASRALFVQAVGRGMRTSPGKACCLLLDFGTNLERLGAIDDQHRQAVEAQAIWRTIQEAKSERDLLADARAVMKKMEKRVRAEKDEGKDLSSEPASLPALGSHPGTGLVDGAEMVGVRCKLHALKLYRTHAGAHGILAIYSAQRGTMVFKLGHLVTFGSDAAIGKAWQWWRAHFLDVPTASNASACMEALALHLGLERGLSWTARNLGDLKGGLPVPAGVPEIICEVKRRGSYLNLQSINRAS